jgi:bifunctional enzyme CysN/CysC
MLDAGLIVLCSFISPYRAERRLARELVGADEFIEIYVEAPLDECMRRDPKGLYAKANAGLIPNFTGVSSPYEAPEQAELTLDTLAHRPAELADRVIAELRRVGAITSP